MDIADTEAEIMRLSKLETHVTQSVRVSAAYMPEVFHLRSHIRSVIVDLLRHREKLKDPDRADDHEDRVDANSVQARLDRLGGELADAGL
jgi:hypothetical protein